MSQICDKRNKAPGYVTFCNLFYFIFSPRYFLLWDSGHSNSGTSGKDLLSRVRLFETLWTVAHQAPPSMGFSRQEYWSGLPFSSPKKKMIPLVPNPNWSPCCSSPENLAPAWPFSSPSLCHEQRQLLIIWISQLTTWSQISSHFLILIILSIVSLWNLSYSYHKFH